MNDAICLNVKYFSSLFVSVFSGTLAVLDLDIDMCRHRCKCHLQESTLMQHMIRANSQAVSPG